MAGLRAHRKMLSELDSGVFISSISHSDLLETVSQRSFKMNNDEFQGSKR